MPQKKVDCCVYTEGWEETSNIKDLYSNAYDDVLRGWDFVCGQAKPIPALTNRLCRRKMGIDTGEQAAFLNLTNFVRIIPGLK